MTFRLHGVYCPRLRFPVLFYIFGVESVGMRQSSLNGEKSSGDQIGHRGGLSVDSLRRRAGDGSDSAADEEGGIQLGVMAKGNDAGGERIGQRFL